jgi:acyl-CoA thioester hydrolase
MRAHEIEAGPNAHHHTFLVERADIDEFGHANNVVWVRWINDAALAHACAVGLGPDACNALGCVWVVRRHDIEYLLPAFEGQTLQAATWPETVRGATSLRRTIFRREGRVLARAATTWVLVSLASGKPRRVTREMMASYQFEPEA